MEELEVSVEDQQEAIHHHAEHSNERWMLYSALISSVLAVAAAVSGLYASHYANEAMLEQIHASDHWSYYQAKGIKANLAEMRSDILESNDKPVPQALKDKIQEYKKEQQDIKEQATEEGDKSQALMHEHETIASGVTSFQIAIAVTAMSAITRRKHFLLLTLALSLSGFWFITTAFLR